MSASEQEATLKRMMKYIAQGMSKHQALAKAMQEAPAHPDPDRAGKSGDKHDGEK